MVKNRSKDIMTNEEAIEQLNFAISIINRDGIDWLDERDIPVLQVAIDALKKQIVGKQILEAEQSKYSSIFDNRPEYSHGRISGLYDGLGIDYSD